MGQEMNATTNIIIGWRQGPYGVFYIVEKNKQEKNINYAEYSIAPMMHNYTYLIGTLKEGWHEPIGPESIEVIEIGTWQSNTQVLTVRVDKDYPKDIIIRVRHAYIKPIEIIADKKKNETRFVELDYFAETPEGRQEYLEKMGLAKKKQPRRYLGWLDKLEAVAARVMGTENRP